MMNQTQLCKAIIQKYCLDNHKKEEELTDSDLLSSSNLAVAMEYLGLIKNEDMKEYASHRGGLIFQCIEAEEKDVEVSILSVRDILNLLPEN